MQEVPLREARARLSELVNKASQGQVIAITRRGRHVARLVPAQRRTRRLPSMSEFRKALVAGGAKVTGNTVVEMREEERY